VQSKKKKEKKNGLDHDAYSEKKIVSKKEKKGGGGVPFHSSETKRRRRKKGRRKRAATSTNEKNHRKKKGGKRPSIKGGGKLVPIQTFLAKKSKGKRGARITVLRISEKKGTEVEKCSLMAESKKTVGAKKKGGVEGSGNKREKRRGDSLCANSK